MRHLVLPLLVAALLPAVAPAATAEPPALDEVLARGFEVVTLEGERVPLAELVGEGAPVVVDSSGAPPAGPSAPYGRGGSPDTYSGKQDGT